jgi:hypothetical protein
MQTTESSTREGETRSKRFMIKNVNFCMCYAYIDTFITQTIIVINFSPAHRRHW